MFPLSRLPPGTRLARANEELMQAEASFSFHLKQTLTCPFLFSSSDPALAAFCSRVQSICDAITDSNSSTTFISSAFEHLIVIQDKFAEKRAHMKNLEDLFKSSAKTVSSLHKQLIDQPNSEDSRRVRDQLDSAIHSEESVRLDLQSRSLAFEAEFKDYQQEVARVIATLYGQVGEIRSRNEELIAHEVKSLLDSGLNVSLNFAESDLQVEREISRLKEIVQNNDTEMSSFLRVRSFSGDSDLVLVSERLSQEQLFQDSSAEDIIDVMEDKPLVSVDFAKKPQQPPSSEPATERQAEGSGGNSMMGLWHKVCSELRAIKM